MAGDKETVPKEQYKERVKSEHKALFIQTVVLIIAAVGISAFFYIQVSGVNPYSETKAL
jgi:hypothetical protein